MKKKIDFKTELRELARKAKLASYQLAQLSTATKNETLLEMADDLERNQELLIKENRKDLAAGEKVCVVLGDNLIEKNIRRAVEMFQRQKQGAKILLKEVPDPQRFGVPELKGERIIRIEEKPGQPKSQYAVIGIYLYDATVFEIIKTLKPSSRGELEITDVNNEYIEKGLMTSLLTW
jgi:dTDP-glucose pyrophosphorylase